MMDGAPTKPVQPLPRRNQLPWWGAGQSPCRKGQPAETRVAATRPRLEEVWARWKRHWRSHRQLEEGHKPRTLRPVLGDEGEEGPVRHPKLRQNPGKNGLRRKSARQETVPGLEERVRPRRERVSVGWEKMEQRWWSEVEHRSNITGHRRRKDQNTSKLRDHAELGSWWGRERESARTLWIPGRNCGASWIRRDSAQRRNPRATVSRAGDQFPPPL